MSDPLLATLRDTFGFPAFRAGQEPVVRALLADRSALAIFPRARANPSATSLPRCTCPA